MGKPFKSELQQLDNAINWSNNIDITEISNFIQRNNDNHLILVGSGGSLSICYHIATLHRGIGMQATVHTPLGLYNAKEVIKKSAIILISSSGKNSDIIQAFKVSIKNNPIDLLSVCMKIGSKLSALTPPTFSIWERDISTGKDGFLATNTLLSYYIIFSRVYQKYYRSLLKIDSRVTPSDNFLTFDYSNISSFSVLYGKWSESIAYDIESKLSEAALGNVQLCDYRNFGHGRHHWFAKRNIGSLILALITPHEQELAQKTLNSLPSNIQIVRLQTDAPNYSGSIELLIKSYYFVNQVGITRKIDPGKPGVPDFGRKLYNLQYIKTLKQDRPQYLTENEFNAISKKYDNIALHLNNEEELKKWKSNLRTYKDRINKQQFSSVIFDYDGTICNEKNRFSGPSNDIFVLLNKLLKSNIIVGFASGRGKSLKTDLRSKIEQKYWAQVIIGYYNGTDISTLGSDTSPNIKNSVNPNLAAFLESINQFDELTSTIKWKLRPNQLTIEPENHSMWNNRKLFLNDVFKSYHFDNTLKLLESCHSMDIIPKEFSKTLVVKNILQELKKSGRQGILCIGDRGDIKGNDFELLNNASALSVDKVSSLPNSCWNLLPGGLKGEEGVLYYFSRLQLVNDSFSIKI